MGHLNLNLIVLVKWARRRGGAAAEWTAIRSTLRSRLRATLSRPPGAPLPVLLPRNILKRLRRRRGGHSTRYLSRGARWTIACDAQKRGLLAHLGASAGPPCRLIYYHNNQEMGKSQSHISPHFAPVEYIYIYCKSKYHQLEAPSK